jgi:hypothetical protein
MNKEQFDKLQRGFNKVNNYKDLNFDLLDEKHGAVLAGGYCITSALKMWLQSGYADYHRRPYHGGFFDNALRGKYLFDPSSEDAVKSDLVAEIQTKFPDVRVITAEVKCDIPRRAWRVRLVVQDLRTKLIDDSMATEALVVAAV